MEEPESTKKRFTRKFGERISFGIIFVLTIFFLSFYGLEQVSSNEKLEEVVPSGEIQSSIDIYEPEHVSYPQVTEPVATVTQEPLEKDSAILPTSTPSPTSPPATTQNITSSVALTPTVVPNIPSPTLVPAVEVTQAPALDTGSDEVWEALAKCESGNNWSIDTGNGYFGGLQFSQSAWESVGGSGNPAHASREEQISRGKMLQERRGGFSAWGTCATRLGLN